MERIERPDLMETTDRVLLVDDQPIVAEAVRRMIASVAACEYRSVQDPAQAVEAALAFRPTVILQDIEMPGMNGLELLPAYRAHPDLRDVPVIMLTGKEDPQVKADAFARGASDYLVKLPHPVELVARIRHHSRGYRFQLERNAAYTALAESEAHMKAEINRAAAYVRSLLDPPMTEGPVRADWRFIPCEALGGDVFGYHWIDDDHLAAYVIDVSGHGVGPALMGVSAMNLIRSGSLEREQVLDPTRTLEALNAAFQMSRHDGMYFTVWYGVYDRRTRELAWAGGGHPPAFLLRGGELRRLDSTSFMIGAVESYEAPTMRTTLEPGDRLYLFSDGVFELHMGDGDIWGLERLEAFLQAAAPAVALDAVVEETRRVALAGRGVVPTDIPGAQTGPAWDDDFSLIELVVN
jgi:sigma-B regulation protein RsbU (phosphoserine phosphatase)